jgi:nucleoside-diphosphate-sugar epimerase
MILITGANGFIGARLRALLDQAGVPVLAVDREAGPGTSGPISVGDIGDAAFLAPLFEKHPIRAVVHLASLLSTQSSLLPFDAMRVNIGGSLHLLRLAAEQGKLRFVYGSSISAYGSKPFERYGAVSELEPAAPEDLYGVGKRYVELAGEGYQARGALEFVALRLPVVVGAGGRAGFSRWRSELFEALPRREAARVEVPYQAGARLPLAHVADVAATLARLAQAPRLPSSVYNLAGETWSVAELAAKLSALNPKLELVPGSRTVSGFPEVLSGERLQAELADSGVPLGTRLEQTLDGSA